jgi:AcrR family transcriptional regulator
LGYAPGIGVAGVNVETEPRPDQVPNETAPSPATGERRGRPRHPATQDAILQATIELLTEVGVVGTTTNAIVARSGSSKATIYRRWASRDALILDALRTVFGGRTDDIQSVVDLEHELGVTRAAARRGARVFGSRIFREGFPTAARDLLSGGAIGRKFRLDVFKPIREAATARLRAQGAREKMDATVDADLIFDLIYGGLLYRSLMGEPIDDTVADSVADLVKAGAPGSRSPDHGASAEQDLNPRIRSRS